MEPAETTSGTNWIGDQMGPREGSNAVGWGNKSPVHLGDCDPLADGYQGKTHRKLRIIAPVRCGNSRTSKVNIQNLNRAQSRDASP
jgi:hypothetical protein